MVVQEELKQPGAGPDSLPVPRRVPVPAERPSAALLGAESMLGADWTMPQECCHLCCPAIAIASQAKF